MESESLSQRKKMYFALWLEVVGNLPAKISLSMTIVMACEGHPMHLVKMGNRRLTIYWQWTRNFSGMLAAWWLCCAQKLL